MSINALAGWFGSNRLLAHHVGVALEGCSWVGIPFVGGFSEVAEIKARTILCSDLHRHVINLARVVASDSVRPILIRRLRRKAFHPDELRDAQELCRDREPIDPSGDLALAEAYFVCCWMGRAAKAGRDDEFKVHHSIRWKADGGDCAVRYQSAIRMLATFGRTLRRCTFETMDAFDFLARCEDLLGHGIYSDSPFPGAGRRYKHNAGKTDDEERAWHTRLRDSLERFATARVICRFYDHSLVRELYAEDKWTWHHLQGRKQTNESAEEVLLIRNAGHPIGKLFA